MDYQLQQTGLEVQNILNQAPGVVSVEALNTIDTTGVFYVKNEEDDVAGIFFCYEGKDDYDQSYYTQVLLFGNKIFMRAGQLPLTDQWIDYNQMAIDGKVDKRTGYGLSKNDFTDYYKGTIEALMRDVARLTDGKLGWEFVAELPAISYNTLNKVYFIQSTTDANCVDAYIVDTSSAPSSWKQIGKSIDTSSFVLKTDVDNALSTTSENPIQNKVVTTALNGKQATVSDLATIRSGAAAGATAYQKPQAGIPKTDLASDVQTSLGKADTALQSHQDISGKADVAALAGYTPTANFATINGASITGGGDVIITAGSSSITTIDATPTSGSTNPVQSGGVYDTIEGGFYY